MAKTMPPPEGTFRDAQSKQDADGEGATVHRISNGFDAEHLKSYVERIESVQAEIDKNAQELRDKNAPLRESIAEIKKEANENDGIPRLELNTVIRERRLRAKAEACRELLSDEQRETYDQIKHALGMLADLPLGDAALSNATH